MALDTTPPEAFVQPRPQLEPKNQLANDLREAITNLYSQAQKSTTSQNNPKTTLEKFEARKKAIDEAYTAMKDMSADISDMQDSLHQSVELDPLYPSLETTVHQEKDCRRKSHLAKSAQQSFRPPPFQKVI